MPACETEDWLYAGAACHLGWLIRTLHSTLRVSNALAVKENAAEACTTACQDEQSTGMALATGQGGDKDANNARLKEAFESCYTKCVAQETKDVAEERQKVTTTPAPE